jgi:hypothetical protein
MEDAGGRCPTRIVAVAAVAGVALSLATAAFGRQSATQPHAPVSSGKGPLDTVTVEGQRERKEVEREVNEFVLAVAVRSLHDSLSRWNTPVCPLVAGLPKEQGEFVLARLSQIAREAKAPLAGEHCKANFYIVVTPQPEVLLKKWQARDRRMFDTRNGMGHVRRFLDDPRAVRVWYNVGFASTDGKPITSDSLAGALVGTAFGMNLQLASIPTNTVSMATRLSYSAVRSLSSVIVVVDANHVQELSFGQLADYVGMVGLAEVNQDAEVGPVPTILRLSSEPRSAAGPERLGSGIPRFAVRRRSGERRGAADDEEEHGEHPRALARSETATPAVRVRATFCLVGCLYPITATAHMKQP